MPRKPDDLKKLIATVPGVSAQLDDPQPTSKETAPETTTQPAEPVDVPDSLVALFAAHGVFLPEIKTELDSEAQVRNARMAKRAAARAAVETAIVKANPLDGTPDTQLDHKKAMVRREIAEALRLFDGENPNPPQVCFAVAEAFSILTRHEHELRQIASRLGPGLQEHAAEEKRWEAACAAGADRRYARELAAKQAEIRRALEHEENLENLRQQAKDFGMLDKSGKLSRVPQ